MTLEFPGRDLWGGFTRLFPGGGAMNFIYFFYLVLVYLVDFGLFVIAPKWVITRILENFYKGYVRERDKPHHWRGEALGLLERSMYFGAWLAGRPEFIAVWLTFKAVDRWTRARDDFSIPNEIIEAHVNHEAFIIGSGLSIVYGAMGGIVVQLFLQGNYPAAVFLGAGTFLGGLLFNLYIECQAEKHPRKPFQDF